MFGDWEFGQVYFGGLPVTYGAVVIVTPGSGAAHPDPYRYLLGRLDEPLDDDVAIAIVLLNA